MCTATDKRQIKISPILFMPNLWLFPAKYNDRQYFRLYGTVLCWCGFPLCSEITVFVTSFPEEMVCVNYTIVDDDLFEGLEVVTITVQSANTTIGNFSETFLVYIIDNDNSEL